MNLGITLTAIALIITAPVTAPEATAAGLDTRTTPQFLERAEAALASGKLERAVGLLAPRIHRLRSDTMRNRAWATLCNAHLRQKALRSAGEACHEAVATPAATWSDYNNLGAYYYLIGDLAKARETFEQAAAMAPGEEAVTVNLEATVAAAGT